MDEAFAKRQRINGQIYQISMRVPDAALPKGCVLGIVGSTEELGNWDVTKAIRLVKSAEDPAKKILPRPLSGVSITKRIEFRFIFISEDSSITTSEFDSDDAVKFFDAEPGLSYQVNPPPLGMPGGPTGRGLIDANGQSIDCEADFKTGPAGLNGLKVVVFGSSVAAGQGSQARWDDLSLPAGWARLLGETLHTKYGHEVINVSRGGLTTQTAADLFPKRVPVQKPDVVIIGLSLGNEGLSSCQTAEQTHVVIAAFTKGLQCLLDLIRDIGALPVLAGCYCNTGFSRVHHEALKDMDRRLDNFQVPVIHFLSAVDDGNGHWKKEHQFDWAHPNAAGHRAMYDAIDLSLFAPEKIQHRVHEQLVCQ